MSKFMMTALASALAFSGAAWAGDTDTKRTQNQPSATQQSMTGLENCNRFSGAQRESCIAEARQTLPPQSTNANAGSTSASDREAVTTDTADAATKPGRSSEVDAAVVDPAGNTAKSADNTQRSQNQPSTNQQNSTASDRETVTTDAADAATKPGRSSETDAAVVDPAANAATRSDTTKRDQEYRMALKKCEPMSPSEKQQCVNSTKQQFSRM